MTRLVLSLAFCCCLPLVLAAQDAGAKKDEPAPKVRALIVTGDDVPAHPWKETTPVMREILEATGRFDVRVSEDGEILGSKALANYDVIILNLRDGPGREVGAEALKNLQTAVEAGKGLVAVHFSFNAFRNWEGYKDLIGRVWTKGSGHGPRGQFKVAIAKKDHPITSGLSDFVADDELYAGLVGKTELNVLATSESTHTKRVEPIAWTLEVGKGKVFSLGLGHDARARRNAWFGVLLARGAEWAATGKVAPDSPSPR